MNAIFGKSFYPLIMPVFLFGIAFALLFQIDTMPEIIIDVLDFLPYIVAGIGILLAWWFDSSRAVFALFMIVSGYAMLWLCFPDGFEDDVFSSVGFSAYCFLLPLNLLVFSFLEERGILTFCGRIRIGAILLQFLLIAVIITGGFGQLDTESTLYIQQTASNWLNIKIFPFSNQTFLPHISLIAFLFVLIVFFIKTSITCKPMDSGFLGAIISTAAGLHFVGNSSGVAIFFCLATFMLVSAVIQDSYRMAFIDELTELSGRRALIKDMKKLGSKYSIAMGDIDFFKKFNDTYGHQAGDEVLRQVSQMLKKSVKPTDLAARYGGEEMVIILSDADINNAVLIAERICKTIAERKFELIKERMVNVTISLGVASYPIHGKTSTELIEFADKGLYRAKENGRNQVGQLPDVSESQKLIKKKR